jgi:dienelactone hydrolase
LLWSVAARANWKPKDLPGGDFRAAIAFYPNCFRVNQARSWSTSIPLLVLMGDIDNYTPPKPCVELLDRARRAGAPVEIELFPNSHHAFDAPNYSVRVVTSVRFRDGTSPTIGANAETRVLAIQRTRDYFAQYLKE